MIVVALVVLLAGLATGPVAHRASTARPPRVAHVPDQPIWVRPAPPFPFRVWLVAAAVSVALTVGAALAAPEFEVAAAILGFAVLGLITAIFHRYAGGCAEVRAAVEAYEPRVAVVDPGEVGVDLTPWTQAAEGAGIPYVVVAGSPERFGELAGQHDAPVVEGTVPASIVAALHPRDVGASATLVEASDATHVLLEHDPGDAASTVARRLRRYDLVAVASQSALDRLVAADPDIPAGRLRIIGPKPSAPRSARRLVDLLHELAGPTPDRS